jgi:lysophospholipase L1-like esterase
MRLLIIVIYLVTALVTVAFLLFGVISFFSTLTLYATVCLLILLAIRFLPESKVPHRLKLNLKLTAISLLLTLCVTDLVLRYVIKPAQYLDHNENNGGWCYSSYPLRTKFRFITKHIYTFERENGYLFTNPANKSRLISNNEFSYPHRYNNEGLRNKDIPVEKQKNEIRLIALGDSYTEGVGAPQDSTWPVLFENGLQKSAPPGNFYTVINAGVYGSDPFFESYLLKARLLKYKPDIVMVAINNSDINDVEERGGNERFGPDSTIVLKSTPWWEPIYGASIIARMIVRNVFKYSNTLVPERESGARYQQACSGLATAINDMALTAKENGFKLYIIFHPAMDELGAARYNLDVTKELIKDSTIHVIDLQRGYSTYFKQNNLNPKDYFWPKDSHPNPKGYLVWSELLLADMNTSLHGQ